MSIQKPFRKIQGGNDQEKAQSERKSPFKTKVGKTKLTIRYLYYVTLI